MPGADESQVHALVAVGQVGADRGAQLAALGIDDEDVVEALERAFRATLVQRRRAQRVARERRDRGCNRALAGDVADDDHPAVHRREQVVEVAAHLGGHAGGAEASRDRQPGHVGEARRQQAALQRGGDVRARRVHAGVGDRDTGAAADLLHQCEIREAQPAPGPGADERDRPPRLLARDDEWDDGHRGQLVRRARAERDVVEARLARRGALERLVGERFKALGLGDVEVRDRHPAQAEDHVLDDCPSPREAGARQAPQDDLDC